MSLFPNEEYLIRKETWYKGNVGTLGITNIRLIWSPHNHNANSIMFDYQSISEPVEGVTDLEKGTSVLRVKGLEPNKRRVVAYFAFKSANHSEDMQTCTEYINSYMNQKTKVDERFFLSENTQKKIQILCQEKELSELHKWLVREGDMDEELFWKHNSQYNQYLLQKRHQEQKAGKLNQVVRIPHRVLRDEVIVDVLGKYKELIFRQLPHLSEEFVQSVPHQKSEIDFWKSFWEKQLESGGALSDALEITPPRVPLKVPLKYRNKTPHYQGQYQIKGTPNSTASHIINEINQHSSYIVLTLTQPPAYNPAVSNEAFTYNFEENKMNLETDSSTGEEWTQALNLAMQGKLEPYFPKHGESAETIRQIFHQTLTQKVSEKVDEESVTKLAGQLYEVIKHFYSEFPVKNQQSIKRMEKVVEIAQSMWNQISEKVSSRSTLELLRNMVQVASDRLLQLKTNFT